MTLDAHGLPAYVTRHLERGSPRSYPVEQVQEVWRVAEAWWRENPVHRTYYRLTIEGGGALTLFHDDVEAGHNATEGWYEQRY